MAITQTLVVFDWSDLGGGTPTGTDTLELSEEISDGIAELRPPVITSAAALSSLGQSALIVPANDDGTTVPQGTYYKHVGRIGTGVVRELKVVTGAGLGTVLSGTGAPSGGADGDWYIQTTTGIAYGPRASGVWPTSGITIGNWDGAVPDGQIYWAALPMIDPEAVASVDPSIGSFSIESLVRANSLSQLRAPTSALSMNGQRLTDLAPPAAITDAPQAKGSLIGATHYEPATGTDYGIATATGAAVDPTNLNVSFTAISTVALVELTAPVAYVSGSGTLGWTLYTHGTLTQQGYWVAVTTDQAVNGVARIRVSGLTIGTTYQWDWGWATAGSGTAVIILGCTKNATFAGIDSGPAIMRVFAA